MLRTRRRRDPQSRRAVPATRNPRSTPMSHPDDHHAPTSPRPATEAQRAASRANGARSRGPTTPEGRARSRGNALKHGLTGAGDVLPPDLDADFRAKAEAYGRILQPQDELQRDLVGRAALAAVRLEYGRRHEAAALRRRIAAALADCDGRRDAAVAEAAGRLSRDPAAALRELQRDAAGLQWLIDRWGELGRALHVRGHWDDQQLEQALELLGHRDVPDETGEPRAAALVAAALGAQPSPSRDDIQDYFGKVPPPGSAAWPDLKPLLARLPSRERARAHLAEVVAEEVRRLTELRDQSEEQEDDAEARAEAVEQVLFDPGPEAVRLRQYESTQARELSRSLADLERLKKARAATPAAAPAENEPGAAAEPPPPPPARPAASPEDATDDAPSSPSAAPENEPGAPGASGPIQGADGPCPPVKGPCADPPPA
jgi:hypothetical protein